MGNVYGCTSRLIYSIPNIVCALCLEIRFRCCWWLDRPIIFPSDKITMCNSLAQYFALRLSEIIPTIVPSCLSPNNNYLVAGGRLSFIARIKGDGRLTAVNHSFTPRSLHWHIHAPVNEKNLGLWRVHRDCDGFTIYRRTLSRSSSEKCIPTCR